MSKAWKRGKYLPPSVTTPGYSVDYGQPDYKKGTPGSVNVRMDPTQEMLRGKYTNVLESGLDSMLAPRQNVGGFGAISPELYQEFLASNNAANPEAFYDKSGFDSILGQNYGMANTANAEAQRMLSQGFEGNMGNFLSLLRAQAAPGENNMLQGNYDKQFSRGILGSTAGAYQTQGITEGLGQADLARQLQAYGMSQDAINQAVARASGFSNAYMGMEGDAANRMFGVNNAIYNRTTDRFARANNLFNTGQGADSMNFARALQTAGAGAGFLSGQNAELQQLMNSMFGAGAMQSNANNQAMANQIASSGNSMGMFGGLLNSAIGSAGNIAGSYLQGGFAASDRRLKKDIKRIGATPAGYPLYSFTYIWGEPSVGVMADEVPADWVSYDDNGYALVDYNKVK